MLSSPEDVLEFWLDDVRPEQWYSVDENLDRTIRERFEPTWQKAVDGGLSQWMSYASGCLAYIILTDQFSRNMFRGEGKAFSTDFAARAVAKQAIDKSWDLRIDLPARFFFYMPLMHSENLCDQERCMRLMKDRTEIESEKSLLHSRAHREIIREFGRFPARNAALGRKNTAAETAYLAKGGYGYTVESLQKNLAA